MTLIKYVACIKPDDKLKEKAMDVLASAHAFMGR